MLVSEAVLCLSNKVGVLTNKADAMAPMLVSDLQTLTGDLRGLYEQVLEIEPSRPDLEAVEKRLRAYADDKEEIREAWKRWREQAERIDTICSCGPNPSNDCRVQGGVVEFAAQKVIELKEAHEERLADKISRLERDVLEIETAIDTLPERMRRFVILRYVKKWAMDDVAAELYCSRQWAYQLREEALSSLSRVLGVNT